jgi:hypothetical protein
MARTMETTPIHRMHVFVQIPQLEKQITFCYSCVNKGIFILDKDSLPKGVKMEDIKKVHIFIGIPNVEVNVGNNMG